MNTPTIKKSAKAILSVRIPVALIQELDSFAAQSGIERSTLVRLAIQNGLTTVKKVAAAVQGE